MQIVPQGVLDVCILVLDALGKQRMLINVVKGWS